MTDLVGGQVNLRGAAFGIVCTVAGAAGGAGAGFVRPLYLIVVIALPRKLLYERVTGVG